VRPAGAAAGLLADMVLGEPPLEPHPLVRFGRLMDRVEGRLYADRRWPGVLHAAAGTATGVATGAALGSTAVAAYLAVAQKGLVAAAEEVADALRLGDTDGARALLPALVGRDPSGLDETEIVRATVESLAENTVDAVVAPTLWAAIGAAPGALAYRAINTLDSTVGHRSPRYRQYGWASARLDDLANWVPARATALLVAAVRPRRAPAVWRAVYRQAGAHPSPNAGVAEAAFAAALGVRLGGTNRYGERVETRPALGQGRPPEPADIAAAVALCRQVSLALVGVLLGWSRWRRR
jgi:adenosylcobinamide-phosphate synthase